MNDNQFADLSSYTLTVGEASSLMATKRCKYPSQRKVQRLCRDGAIDCYKLSTTRNGQPVSEWLVSETSLLKRIEDEEVKLDDADTSVTPTARGVASQNDYGHNQPDAVAAPDHAGNASEKHDPDGSVHNSGDASASPDSLGVAKDDSDSRNEQENAGDDMASPEPVGDAIGERRTLASVLIDNARLTAELEGTKALIEEVRDDREFLRDELKEARSGRKDVTQIAERMLETLEAMSIGGRLSRRSEATASEVVATPREDQTTPAEQPSYDPTDGDNSRADIERYRV